MAMEGNQMKMREALAFCLRIIGENGIRGNVFIDDIREAHRVITAALAAPPRVCDVNTLESLSDFVEKTILTSDLLNDTPEIVKRIAMASVRTALTVAYEPAKEERSEDLRTMLE